MAKILIVFSTIGGNTELVVEKVAQLLTLKKHEVEIQRVDTAKVEQLKQYELVILASPTYNQGTLEDHFRPFIKDFAKQDWKDSPFAIIGLGDTKYYFEYLTEAAGILEENLKKVEAKLIIPSLRITGHPLKLLDKLVPRWVDKLDAEINNL